MVDQHLISGVQKVQDFLPESRAYAERLGVGLYLFEVAQVEELTHAFRRISFTATSLEGFTFLPGQDMMFTVDTIHGVAVRRRYTIRSFNPEKRILVCDVVTHELGPGGRWMTKAHVGTQVEAIGPRGKVARIEDAAWHLFVGDTSYLPNASVMAESVPPSQQSAIIIALEAADTIPPQNMLPVHIQPQWERWSNTDLTMQQKFVAALHAWEIPEAHGHIYIGGETQLVIQIRKAFVDRGMLPSMLTTKAYWRAGEENAVNGEPIRVEE